MITPKQMASDVCKIIKKQSKGNKKLEIALANAIGNFFFYKV